MTKTIKSYSDPRKHYFLTIDDETGQAVDCQCPDCQIRRRQCKHQRDFNAEVAKALVFNELRRRYDCRLNGQAAAQRINFELAMGL
jgi:hypothetical protein